MRQAPLDPKIRELIHKLGGACVLAAENAEDEGDRVYFGSSNHHNVVKSAAELYDEYRFGTGDLGEDIELP